MINGRRGLYEACSTIFEIYPPKDEGIAAVGVRLGFAVRSLDQAIEAAVAVGGKLLTPPEDSTWGRRAVLADPDGYRVELTALGDGKLASGIDATDLVDLIDSISKRPAMYVGIASISAIGHYLNGFRHALYLVVQPDPLDGWMRWVELRFEIHHPAWHWTRILLHVYGSDEAAIQNLPELCRDYVQARAELGADGIETKLRETLLAQHGRDWHEPDHTHTQPTSGD